MRHINLQRIARRPVAVHQLPRQLNLNNPEGLITDAAIADAAKRMAAIDRANALLAKLDDGVNIRFLDIGGVFLGRDGKIPWTLMPDQLHPTAAGYQLWAEAMQPLLLSMIK